MDENEVSECEFCGYQTKLSYFDNGGWLCVVCAQSVSGQDLRSHSTVAKQISYTTNMILEKLQDGVYRP